MPSLISDPALPSRTAQLFRDHLDVTHRRTDRLFAWLMVIQWLAGIMAACWISPKAWEGQFSHTHIHVWAAILLGGLLTSVPVWLAVTRPGATTTRHIIAIGQMLTSGLLVHLSGGRIETHFHYFGSLAFIAIYRDWRVLLSATLVVAADHFLRGWFWPQSIFGVLTVNSWRWLEHSAWVLFEDVFLLVAMRQNLRETLAVAERQAGLEALKESFERKVAERTRELQAEVGGHKRTEEGLRRSETQLAAAQNIARIGSWEWEVSAHKLTWSDENFRLHGFPPREFEVSYDSVLAFIHPDDRRHSAAALQRARQDGKPFSFEQRIVWPDGTERIIHQRGDVVPGPDGRVAKLVGTAQDVTDQKRAEDELEKVHQQLLDTSRQAGRAEVATSVLHNVGNVLNSVNVSATLVGDRMRQSKTASLPKLGALLQEHAGDLADFLTNDGKGRRIPAYLQLLAEQISAEQMTMTDELDHLRKNIEHIKVIIAQQQSQGKVSGLTETVAISDLVEDALRMNAGVLARHGLEVVRDYQARLTLTVDRHKVMQILVNLIRNAQIACDDSGRTDKQVTVRITRDEGHVHVAVSDNGVGIPPENLARIFHHGFTTRNTGHGFGLHSAVAATKEMGGSLTVHSDGPGTGAMFILTLPLSDTRETIVAAVSPELTAPVA